VPRKTVERGAELFTREQLRRFVGTVFSSKKRLDWHRSAQRQLGAVFSWMTGYLPGVACWQQRMKPSRGMPASRCTLQLSVPVQLI
jgi:hypothetical protein